MSRVKRFAASMATGYLAMAVNIAYTMLSIPLALYYLGKEEFGLWALALQISGYLMLLDLGMSTALSRFVADHKDETEGNNYGSLFLTGTLVFVVQGVLIALVGVAFSFFAPHLFAVPPASMNDFRNVLCILSIVAGISVMLRSLGSPLWAYQRLDMINLNAAIGLLLALGLLWFGFISGWGIYAFAFAGIPGLVTGTAMAVWICQRKGYYPKRGRWGRPRWAMFKTVFAFGKDLLLMNFGSQLVNASQIMLISQKLGLESAATFAVATKFYTMGQQFVAKILEGSAPVLTEMFVRGDLRQFRKRIWDVITLTAAMALVGATCLVLANRSIVSIWTSGAVVWTLAGDVLLGSLILVTSLSRCFVGIHGMAGNLTPVRALNFMEGLFFVLMAWLLAPQWGIEGVLVASLLAHVLLTGWLSVVRARGLIGNLMPALGIMLTSLVFLGGSAALAFGMEQLGTSKPVLIMVSLAGAAVVGSGAWIFLLTADLKREVVDKIRRIIFKP